MCLFALLCSRITNQTLQEGHLPTLTSERSQGTFSLALSILQAERLQ